MTDTVLVALIVAAPAAVTIALKVSHEILKRQTLELEHKINSRLDEMLELVRKSAKAEGREEMRMEQVERAEREALSKKD